MILESPAFADGQPIPKRYTCDGDDVSPPLNWRDVPAGARALALIMEDPDAPAGTWVHWVLIDLDPDSTGIPEGGTSSAGVVEGSNSWGRTGYGGPCPPSGTHRYFLRLYALSQPLGMRPGSTAAEVHEAARPHALGEAVLMGRYSRQG